LATPYVELGGVEITDHSPDGSNADKRYPYLWASRQHLLDAFIVCPYQKTRTQGASNRLPFRHARRNRQFAERWDPVEQSSHLLQILPITDLQQELGSVPNSIATRMWSFEKIGEFFALRVAQHTLSGAETGRANARLAELRQELLELVAACEENTNHTDPTSLFIDQDRWVQVYNSRPDSGHWERGEGQFDSIDGRLMFTLDGIDFLDEEAQPQELQFWLPQMVRAHPWLEEQRQRGYGSKRFRNITQTLADHLSVKYADELADEDWEILEANPSLTLERLDWAPAIFSFQELLHDRTVPTVARKGLRAVSADLIGEIESCLRREALFFSAHRATRRGWRDSLVGGVNRLPSGSTLLVPRIPSGLLAALHVPAGVTLVPAEGVTKTELLSLRQLHRTSNRRSRQNGWTG